MTHFPEDEQLLGRFREWLDTTRAETETLGESAGTDAWHDVRSAGLFDLIEAFTALRHEVKLQTKSSRSLHESAEQTIEAINKAIEEFKSVKPREAAIASSLARGFAESLADLSEALQRGRAVVEKTAQRVPAEFVLEYNQWLDEESRDMSWLQRLVNRGLTERLRSRGLQYIKTSHTPLFASIVDGYRLTQQRLQRALKQHGIRRMTCVGEPVDPNAMTVVAVVEAPGRPPGTVIEEVRPGYYLKSEILRFAEVKASIDSAVELPAATDRMPPEHAE